VTEFCDRPAFVCSSFLTSEELDAFIDSSKNGKAVALSRYDGTVKWRRQCRTSLAGWLERRYPELKMGIREVDGRAIVWTEERKVRACR